MDLDPARVVKVAQQLEARVAERFPDSGLRKVAAGIAEIGAEAALTAKRLARPNIPLRILVVLLLAAIPATLIIGLVEYYDRLGVRTLAEGVAFFQATIESFIFLGAGVFFLTSIEARRRRNRALEAIEPLRDLAHRVDMHQLNKDPVYVISEGQRTASSPERTMTAFELNRYLDYCCEMLSLIGKIAAFYGRELHDPVAHTAVDQIESLTTGLSSKIWQKAMLLSRG